MHVLVEARDEPWVQDAEPSTCFHAIDGAEDGKQAVLERFAARALLRKARGSDCAVVGRKTLEP